MSYVVIKIGICYEIVSMEFKLHTLSILHFAIILVIDIKSRNKENNVIENSNNLLEVHFE